ncbi:MAG: antitoxin [Acidimicrobiia bacterium]
MARISVYLPDQLAERVRNAPDLNVSAVCQRALTKEASGDMADDEDEDINREILAALDKMTGRLDQMIETLKTVLAHGA